MEYTLKILEDQKIIHITAKGQWDKQTEDLMTHEILSTVSKLSLKKVLLDMREVDFEMSLADIFQRTQELREQRIESRTFSFKVAIIYVSKDRKTEDNFSFFETAARNRGLPYKIFTGLDEAFAWLTESLPV